MEPLSFKGEFKNPTAKPARSNETVVLGLTFGAEMDVHDANELLTAGSPLLGETCAVRFGSDDEPMRATLAKLSVAATAEAAAKVVLAIEWLAELDEFEDVWAAWLPRRGKEISLTIRPEPKQGSLRLAGEE